MGLRRFDIRPATVSDAHSINEIMVEAQKSLANRDHFIISDYDRVVEKLETDCWGWVVFCDPTKSMPIAYYLFQQPSADNVDDNLGYEIGLSGDELERVLVLDTVAVLPEYRGAGLQSALSALGEAEGKARGLTHFMATVHPGNTYSVRNFISAGYSIVKEKQMYGSVNEDGALGVRGSVRSDKVSRAVPRYVLHKYVGN